VTDWDPVVPQGARPYQGANAGVATRVVAASIDVVAVGLGLGLGYGSYVGLRLLLSPRSYQLPDPSVTGSATAFLVVLVLYLSVLWATTGRTYGDHVMGITVVGGHGARLGPVRAFVRAVLYAVFPLGLLWCAISAKRHSLQDVVLRTEVVYAWLPHPVENHAGDVEGWSGGTPSR
jgi:uncharacterized RDD family membrane protein YckC